MTSTTNPFKKKKFSDFIIHEDDDFIIINKPPHVSTLSDRNDSFNILELARGYFNDVKVCHRLDKETSGALVLAKSDVVYKYFSGLLEHRLVHKLYHAIVSGRQDIEEQEINAPIYTSSSKSRVDFHQGKPSNTLITTKAIYKSHSLLACMPVTGRMHQIRVHLAQIGLPIIGDRIYGGSDIYLSEIKKNYKYGKFAEERPLLPRLALHAEGLRFPDREEKEISIQAPYPKDFAAATNQLEKNR